MSDEYDILLGRIECFFKGGIGPTHSALSRVFEDLGIGDDYKYSPGVAGPSKQKRIRAAFRLAQRRPEIREGFIRKIIALLVLNGDLEERDAESRVKLAEALAMCGFELTEHNQIESIGPVDLSVTGRAALEEQLKRLNRSTDDPALLLGVAKELIESIYKFVLEEIGTGVQKNSSFRQLQHLAMDRLQILPQSVDVDRPGGKPLREIYQSAMTLAGAINELRNEQGTGHGRTLPTAVSPEDAIFVIKLASLLAEMLLEKLDRATGTASVSL